MKPVPEQYRRLVKELAENTTACLRDFRYFDWDRYGIFPNDKWWDAARKLGVSQLESEYRQVVDCYGNPIEVAVDIIDGSPAVNHVRVF